MSAANLNVQLRLTWYARRLLIIAAVMAKLRVRLPHFLVAAVVNRSWRMRVGNGPWLPVRLDARGRVVR